MKILYLVPKFPVASETFVMREVAALRRLGCEIEVLSFDTPSPVEVAKLDGHGQDHFRRTFYLPKYPFGAAANAVMQHSFDPVGRMNHALGQAATVKTNRWLRLARAQATASFARRHGFDRLHAHWPYASQVAPLVQQMTGLPLSVSVHAHEVEHDFGHYACVFQNISFAAFCNRAAMERLLGRLPAQARERSHLIYHGVDLEQFRPLLFPVEHCPLRIISAGRFTRTKGFDRLLRACARFQAEGGKIELTILGDGTVRNELIDLAKSLGFSEHLHLPGWLPHDQVADRFAAAHIFALMADTNFHDGLPNVVLEAMASARPVILSPIPAATEAIENGVEGFILSSADDEAGMVRALQHCAADPSRLPGMGRAALSRMEKDFDATMHAKRLVTLFEGQFEREPKVRPARPRGREGFVRELALAENNNHPTS